MMSGQSDPATEFIAYASVLLLLLYFLSVGIGKVSEWRRRGRAPAEYDVKSIVRNGIVEHPAPPATTMPRNDNDGTTMDTTEYNALLFAAKADALAAMVHAGKVGETEGIKIVFGVGPSSTNKTYQAAREMLKARLARLAPDKFRLTAEQKAVRDGLGLPSKR